MQVFKQVWGVQIAWEELGRCVFKRPRGLLWRALSTSTSSNKDETRHGHTAMYIG